MYIPKDFLQSDEHEIADFINANAFGELISIVNNQLFSSPMPFLLSGDGKSLLGHLALANPQCKSIDDQDVLVTLSGPHDYISPNWYTSRGVPTWNYQAVHINGTCRVFREPERLKGVVDALTEKYEASFEQPWRPDYNEGMLNAIVGVEISLSTVQCKYKLSQNRSTEDQSQVVEQLKAVGSEKLANEMIRVNEITKMA